MGFFCCCLIKFFLSGAVTCVDFKGPRGSLSLEKGGSPLRPATLHSAQGCSLFTCLSILWLYYSLLTSPLPPLTGSAYGVHCIPTTSARREKNTMRTVRLTCCCFLYSSEYSGLILSCRKCSFSKFLHKFTSAFRVKRCFRNLKWEVDAHYYFFFFPFTETLDLHQDLLLCSCSSPLCNWDSSQTAAT